MNVPAAIRALCDAGVEFVLIGGVAAQFLGAARNTFDIDICFARNRENLKKLASALAPFHPRPRGFPKDLPFVWDERTLLNGTVFRLATDLGNFDILGEVAGLGTYEDIGDRTVLIPAFDRMVPTLDLPALIAAKKAAGRPKDLEALLELESLLEAQADD